MATDHETRLSLAEQRLEQHDRLHMDMQSTLADLSRGINELVQAEAKRAQYDQTFERLFTAVESLRSDFMTYKDKQSDKELQAYRGIVIKVIGLAALIVASVVAGHFGGRLVG